jgi:UDP-2,3-diacylglucosamine pyrophosphatase LpxH
MLKENSFRRLILLGDIFSDLNFGRLKKEHWQFLGYIRKLSNPKRNIEVVWVEGNHDHGLTDVMSHLVGVKVYQQYAWEYAGLKHLAVHGHQFDGFQVSNLKLSSIGTSLYLHLQKLDFKGKPCARLIDRLNTRWLRMSEKVARGALNHARQEGVDRIFCGHTHAAMQTERESIGYYNCGSWTDSRPTYISVGNEGVAIHEYTDRTDDHHSSQERGETSAAPFDVAGHAGLLEDLEYEGIGR